MAKDLCDFKIREECEVFHLGDKHIKEIMSRLHNDLLKGLGKDSHAKSIVKCWITYIQDLPNGKERGKFLALDLGGTNFRVLIINLGENHFDMQSKIYAIPNHIMTGTGIALFDHIAECLANFMKEHNVYEERLALGFTFSFPLKQLGLTRGILQRWTKGFSCSGVVGEDVVQGLKDAIARRGDVQIDICAILNDTTGTLMSCAWKNHNCKIGLIVGTGSNACYVEKTENCELFDGETGKQDLLINTEWGAFGDDGTLDIIRTEFDREVDSSSINPGKQIQEKMISGMYMGELVRLALVKFTRMGLLFGGSGSDLLFQRGSFYTKYVSEIESDKIGDYTSCMDVLEELGLSHASEADMAAVRHVCECVSRRAAHLVSAGIAVLINKMKEPHVTVGIDGSVYRFHPHFHALMCEKIAQLVHPGLTENGDNVTDSNTVSQLLSPIITSQRVMAAQFGNTYSSIQCQDNTTIVFDEWLDHVFVIITGDDVNDAHRELLDSKTLVQHICGQNINLLQSPIYQEWLSNLLDCRTKGDNIPGANGFIGESGATVAALNALKAASKDVKLPHSHYHLMLFVGDKMLALYSSRGCEDITPPDLILLSIQCVAAQEYWEELSSSESTRIPWLSLENSAVVNLCAGASNVPCAPHSLHLAELAPRITFAVIVDMDLREVGIATHMANQVLANLRRLLLQRNLDLLPNTLDSLETALKKTTEALRKNKTHSALCARLSTRMLELRKSCTTTTPLTPETTATAMHTALDSVVDLLKPDIPSFKVEQPLEHLRKILAPYVDFLRVKAMRYFTLESGDSELSGSLTVHKYVEEFPGLVHFIYVDRTAGRSLAPDMADCADMLSPTTVRAIVSRSFMVSREGYCGATWRRGALHACAVWWWERGNPVKPTRPPHPAAVRALPAPGDILGSFYRQLTELAFPNDSQGVSMKELICVHLGLLPASTAVMQARRLAHTVHELAGDHPALAADLL